MYGSFYTNLSAYGYLIYYAEIYFSIQSSHISHCFGLVCVWIRLREMEGILGIGLAWVYIVFIIMKSVIIALPLVILKLSNINMMAIYAGSIFIIFWNNISFISLCGLYHWAVISSNNYSHEYAQVRLTKCAGVLKYLLKKFCNGPPMNFLAINSCGY